MNNNTMTITEVLTNLETAVTEYSIKRIEHDNKIKNGEAIDVADLKALSELNERCDDLATEYKKLAKNNFFEEISKDTDNPIRKALTIYEYTVYKVVDETVSKTDNTFAKRKLVEKKVAMNIYDLEKFLDTDSEVIKKQKATVSKLSRELLFKIAKELKAEKAVKDTIADESAMASQVEMSHLTSKKVIKEALQNVVNALYIAEPENTIEIDDADVAYLLNAFTRKGKDRLSIQVLKDGALAFVITDMIHKAFADASYVVYGYKVAK